jgi:acetyl esterase
VPLEDPARVLDPAVQRLLASMPVRLPPFDLATLRIGHQASQDALAGERVPVAAIDGFTVDPDPQRGTPRLAVRRYQPRAGCARAIVWLHGGGWATGTLDGYDAVARALAVDCDSQVFLVDYRLAPESRCPVAFEDCTAALAFIVAHAARFGIDPRRVVLGGDSAGGHLAIGVARRLPGVAAALALVYPVTDARMLHASYARYADGFYLTATMMAWYWQQFLPEGADLSDPDISPLLAHDLPKLPPTLVVTAECDVLRDEGLAFSGALANAGVTQAYLEVPRVIHGFMRFRAGLEQARALPGNIRSQLDRWGI